MPEPTYTLELQTKHLPVLAEVLEDREDELIEKIREAHEAGDLEAEEAYTTEVEAINHFMGQYRKALQDLGGD